MLEDKYKSIGIKISIVLIPACSTLVVTTSIANILQNKRYKYCKIFLNPLTVRVIQKTTVQSLIR